MLTEIEREYFGNDKRAINRHSVRTFRDEYGNLYKLDRCLDAMPRYFTAYGPYHNFTRGLLPWLKVQGKETWGEGLSWNKALVLFKSAIPNMR